MSCQNSNDIRIADTIKKGESKDFLCTLFCSLDCALQSEIEAIVVIMKTKKVHKKVFPRQQSRISCTRYVL